MNLRALSNFLSVAKTGSLKGAAGVVNIAQPALTRQIALLEEEFGVKLFLRHHRGVTLTEAGEQLQEHAERILAEVSRARVAMSTALEKPTGTVSLGLPTAMRAVFSSDLIAAYHTAFPDVYLKVHEAFVHVIEEMLQSRQLDVAILFGGSRKLDNFGVTPLVSENVYLIGAAGAGLDGSKPVSIRELAGLPIILISRRNQLRIVIERALARHSCAFRPFLEVEGQPLTHDLVQRGIGYTIAPYCAVQKEIETGQLSGAPIRDLTITWELGVNRMRAHAPAVQELIQLIHQAVHERMASGSWRAMKPKSTASGKHQNAKLLTRSKQTRMKATRLDRTTAN
jgi:LysR family transcriptional regulator, nitrogen assimilation regulatory protein